jgi:hypothetical protein
VLLPDSEEPVVNDCINVIRKFSETNMDPQRQMVWATWLLVLIGIGTWIVARRSARQQLRAYLGVSFRWTGAGDQNKWLYGEELLTGVFVTNHGQTPARNIRFRGATKVFSKTPSLDEIDRFQFDGRSEAPRPLCPHALPLYFLISCHDAKEERPAGGRVYAIGTINYDDVFDQPHCTKFCVYFDERFGKRTGGPWVVANIHNDIN